jgi:hypothetical protein
MMHFTLFITSLGFIALRAFQQLNVQHDRFAWVPVVSYAMAVCEVTLVTKIMASGSIAAAMPIGTGAFLGCWFSMWLHKRMRKGKCNAH